MGGWSREAVKNYKSLQKIDSEAWETIATSFQNTVAEDDDDAVAEIATGVAKSAFSENLLRNILDLDACQQFELRGYLVKTTGRSEAEVKEALASLAPTERRKRGMEKRAG
jgi:hypothetical protein